MHARRSTVAAVGVVGALVLAGCGQASSSTATTAAAPPTTAGAAVPATASPPAGVPPGLCSTIDAFAAQEQGLASAEENAGGTTGSVTALRQYATRSKGAFDQAAPQITAGLASAPSIVRGVGHGAARHRPVVQRRLHGHQPRRVRPDGGVDRVDQRLHLRQPDPERVRQGGVPLRHGRLSHRPQGSCGVRGR